jgi:DNA-directed RNA polymerase subunit E'/Rpb7
MSYIIDKKITHDISISPFSLNNNLMNNIINSLNHIYLNSCTEENGYILKINNNFTIIDNKISSSGSIIFHIQFIASLLKPIENMFIENATICMIFQYGIFVKIQKLKILIPIPHLKPFIYSPSNNNFFHNKSTLNLDDYINVIILKIKYEKKDFNCIGKLVYNN